jgi:GNAT superfamily N-acetyltransferase
MKFYRHFKNKPYKFIGTAKHSESLEEFVVYETRYENPGGRLWVRPKEMFFESVTRDGKTFQRFAKVEPRIEIVIDLSESDADSLWPLVSKTFPGLERLKFQERLRQNPRAVLIRALIDEKIAGFKLGYAQDSAKFYSWLGAVDEKFRGLGLGRDLIRAQHEWCKSQGFKKIVTKTKNKWRDMVILNLISGFHIIGIYTDDKGEPKLILEKNL